MKVGIIGAGSIAGTMAGTIREMDCAQNYAVAARDYGRAAEFAQTYGFEKAYGSYEELVEDAYLRVMYSLPKAKRPIEFRERPVPEKH